MKAHDVAALLVAGPNLEVELAGYWGPVASLRITEKVGQEAIIVPVVDYSNWTHRPDCTRPEEDHDECLNSVSGEGEPE